MTHMAAEVGVRELRQNLSKYLTRIKAGESLVVTERGNEVARLVPSGPGVDEGYARLAARFGATIPTARIEDVVASFDHEPAPDGTADRILAEGRRERS